MFHADELFKLHIQEVPRNKTAFEKEKPFYPI